MPKTFSSNEVAAHKKPDDLWIIVDDDVYDMTEFQAEHPGKCFAPEFGIKYRLIGSRWSKKYVSCGWNLG